MSGADFLTSSDYELVRVLLADLRADPDLQAALGQPVRLFDAETSAPAFPYAVLERHESREADGVATRRLEHKIQLATFTRYGGLEAAKALLGILRGAVERLSLDLPTQRAVLVMPTYCDVLRTRNQKTLRGVLHIRIVSEAR